MIKKMIPAIILIIFAYLIISAASAEECTSCHKIRHGLTGNFCDNCHYNTTISNGKHLQKPFSPGFVHDSFDWEGDNANEKSPDRLNESCPVCHVRELKRGKLITVRKKDISGGFFAFNARNYTGSVLNRGDPYHWNAPADVMPDSKDCVFCHIQEDDIIKKAATAYIAMWRGNSAAFTGKRSL